MKKIFFIFAVILMINQNIFSQNDDKKVTIQASPLLWFSGIFIEDSKDIMFLTDLEGQFKVSSTINLSLTLSFLFDNHKVESNNRNIYYEENVYQISIKPMLIVRPFETGLRGFYLGFYPNIGFVQVENKYEEELFTELGFGINVGYKWIFKSGFTMQLGGGVGRTFSIPRGSRQYITVNSDGRLSWAQTDMYLLDFKLGYSF